VSQDRVLIIESDEWESALLKRVIVEAGYSVEIAGTARDGFARAQEWLPDCIVCDLALPDIDGLWVARMVRLDPTPLSKTPFLFLATEHDKESRLQGFNVGADVFLPKPYPVEQVVAQVIALIGLARRMEDRVSYGPASSRLAPAMRGDVGQIDLSTVLTLLEMERRTGCLQANVEFLQQALTKLARETQDKMAAADRNFAAARPKSPSLNLRWRS